MSSPGRGARNCSGAAASLAAASFAAAGGNWAAAAAAFLDLSSQRGQLFSCQAAGQQHRALGSHGGFRAGESGGGCAGSGWADSWLGGGLQQVWRAVIWPC